MKYNCSYHNGHSVMVTPNAFQVLRNRSSFWRPKLVWIDSVCIDRSKEDEKAQQIELMEEIYRKAYIVSAALVVDPGMLDFKKELRTLWGDWAAGLWSDMATSPSVIEYQNEVITDLTASLAADVLDDLRLSYFQNQSNHFSWVRKFAPQRYTLRVKAFRQLLANPWFERMWVVQEVALPSSLRIIYGDLEIDWAHLVNAISIINENEMLGGPLLESGDSLGSRVAPPAAYSTIILMARIRQSVQDDQGIPLRELLLRCRQFTATEPKDKLFAIRGMCTKLPEALLKPSESKKKTWEEVYINAAECLVAEGDAARMLVSCGSITERDTQPLETLPSWVPNWSTKQVRSPLSFWHEEKGYKAGGPHVVQARVEARSLLLDGIPFDDILELGPVWNFLPFSTSPWRVSELFADLPALFKASYDLTMWSPWTKEPYPGVQGQRLRDAFWRTMIRNRSYKGDPTPSSLAKQFEIYEQFLADIDKHPERIQSNVEIGVKEQEELVSASDFLLPLTRYWGRRRI